MGSGGVPLSLVGELAPLNLGREGVPSSLVDELVPDVLFIIKLQYSPEPRELPINTFNSFKIHPMFYFVFFKRVQKMGGKFEKVLQIMGFLNVIW